MEVHGYVARSRVTRSRRESTPIGSGRVVLGGSWVVISRVTSGMTILMTHIRRLVTLLIITTHEPPSRVWA